MTHKIPNFASPCYIERASPRYAGFLQKIWPNSVANDLGGPEWDGLQDDLAAVSTFIKETPALDQRLFEEIEFLSKLAKDVEKLEVTE